MKNKKLMAFMSSVLVASIVLTACGRNEAENGKKGTVQAEELAAGKVLNLIEASDIPSMDTAKATDQVSFLVMNNVMEGLYRLDKNQKPTPGVAESYSKSEDGKRYTFQLRKDAKWSNGDAITANDFVFAWRRAVDPSTAAEYAYIMFDIKNARAINEKRAPVDSLGVKEVNDHTLEVQLEHAIPYFLELTSFATFYPQHEKFMKAQGDQFGLKAETTVYNGPFVLTNWKTEQGWTYKKNRQYWDKKSVKLDQIHVSVVKEQGTMVNLYDAGEVDRISLTAEFADKYKASEEFETLQHTSVYFLRFNQKRLGRDTPFSNEKVRQAINLAYNKEGLADVLLNDGSVPAYFLVPAGFVADVKGNDFRKMNGNMNKTDRKKARTLWKQAKRELGMDTVTLEFLNYDSDSSKKVGEYLKEQLEKNLPGLTVHIKPQPFKQKLELETRGDYEFSFSGWGPDYPDPMTFLDMFVTGGTHNQMGYSNVEYDKLVEAGKGGLLTETEARWRALAKAEKILLTDAAISPLYQKGAAIVQRSYVKGIVSHNFGGGYSYKWAYMLEKGAK